MTPEQMEQVVTYSKLIPTLLEADKSKHRRKISMFLEQDGLCCICEKPMNVKYKGASGSFATHEHVICKSLGGSNERQNTPLSHGTCNSKRGTKDFNEFKTAVMNGKIVPTIGGEKQTMHIRAQRGDPDAIEYFLADRLSQLLRLDMIDEGMLPEDKSIPSARRSLIRHKLESYGLNFGIQEFRENRPS